MTAGVRPPTSGRLTTAPPSSPRRRPFRSGPLAHVASPATARPTRRGRPTAAQFRRRRAVAGLVALVLLGGGAVLGVPGGVPLTSSGRAPAANLRGGAEVQAVPVARASYVVRPGDTLWRLARELQPTGDVRPLVQRLDAQRSGAPLRVGERIVVSAG